MDRPLILARAVVRGNSMEPTLASGQVVVLEEGVAAGDLRPGDIVAMRAGAGVGGLVLHRFVQELPDGNLVTRGDNSLRPDAPWEAGALAGRLVGVLDSGGVCWREPLANWRRRCLAAAELRPRRLARVVLRMVKGWAWSPCDGARSEEWQRMEGEARSAAPGTEGTPASGARRRFELQRMGRETALFDNQSGALHLLNGTASHILEALVAGWEVERIVAHLRGLYTDADESTLRRDVESTLKNLLQIGLTPETLPHLSGETK